MGGGMGDGERVATGALSCWRQAGRGSVDFFSRIVIGSGLLARMICITM
jgi:hypothetical protein